MRGEAVKQARIEKRIASRIGSWSVETKARVNSWCELALEIGLTDLGEFGLEKKVLARSFLPA